MRRLLPIPRLPHLSPAMRAQLRWLVVGGVLAAIGGNFLWRLADAHLDAEATRRALAGESAAVVALREDWCDHVLPVALTEPGQAGTAARTVAAAKIHQAASSAARGDTKALQELAPRVLATIRSLEKPPTLEGGRWGEWMLRRLTAASDTLPAAERVKLLLQVDDTLARLAVTPRMAPEPRQEAVVVAAPPAAKPPAEVVAAVPQPVSELVVRPAPVVAAPAPETTPAPMAIASTAPRIATQWRRPEHEAAPIEPTVLDQAAEAPASLGDLELLSEALRIENRLTLSPDGAPRAMGPSRVPTLRDASEAAAHARLEDVRRELVSRGYAAVSRQQVEGLLLPSARERAAFVERLLTDRSGDPARVLLLMAEDEAPEVRAAAISALGGSSNRELVTKALELAMRDQDLRVGKLVEPIRERLR